MVQREIPSLPLYPEARRCRAPTTDRIQELFATAERHQLLKRQRVVQIFEPELEDLQLQVLDLLGVPRSVYLERARY